MSARLRLATPDDLTRLMPMVRDYHAFEGIDRSDEEREAGLMPLLEGSPFGAVWLIGPERGPVGYIAITFGWSVELGGMDGFIDEFFIRAAVRGRGMGSEVLTALLGELRESGLKALHLEVKRENVRAEGLYRRSGFRLRDKYCLMSWEA